MDNPGRAGGDGLIRDSNVAWVKGYARATAHTTSVATVLWALRDGINLCISLNLAAVEIELDAKLIVDLLGQALDTSNANDSILADCKEGLKRIPQERVQHCYREANKCADALTRREAMLAKDFVLFLQPSSDVLFLLNLDYSGVTFDHSLPAATLVSC